MKNRSYDKKMFRFVSILTKLSNKEQVTTAGLSREFDVTKRTIQRDMELLCQMYWPIRFYGGFYKFDEGFSLRKIAVTPEEKLLLTLFYRLFSQAGRPLSTTAKSLLDKVLVSSDVSEQLLDQQTVEIIKKEFSDFSTQLAVRLENNSCPQRFIAKIDEYLINAGDKLKKLSAKEGIAIQFEPTRRYNNGVPIATITIPKAYFKDEIDKFDFSTHENKREFKIISYLPNKYFKKFRISLDLHMAFNFWGTHLETRQITCFDHFAESLGFSKETKLFTYECSHGANNGKHKILITTASLRWEREIPMSSEDIKPFLNKSGRLIPVKKIS